MIIADENIDGKIIKAIRGIPINTISVFESYRGVGD